MATVGGLFTAGDGIRKFAAPPNFRSIYDRDDDYELVRLGFRLLAQVLFGDKTVPFVKGAYDKRYEERKDVIEAKFKLAEELTKQNDPNAKYIDD